MFVCILDADKRLFVISSRLGCQVKVTKEIDGMVAQLPSATRNMYVDGKCKGKREIQDKSLYLLTHTFCLSLSLLQAQRVAMAAKHSR